MATPTGVFAPLSTIGHTRLLLTRPIIHLNIVLRSIAIAMALEPLGSIAESQRSFSRRFFTVRK